MNQDGGRRDEINRFDIILEVGQIGFDNGLEWVSGGGGGGGSGIEEKGPNTKNVS